MTYSILRLMALAATLSLLPACSTIPRSETRAAVDLQSTGLAQADLLVKQANRLARDENAAAVCRLRAGEISWGELSGRTGVVQDVTTLPVAQRQALKILAQSAEELAPLFVRKNRARERTFSYAGRSYRVEAARDAKPGVYAPARLESVRPASEVPRGSMAHWYVDAGAGAPLSPKWYQPSDRGLDRFVPKLGYIEPLTAVLAFGSPTKTGAPRTVTLTAYDPTAVGRVRLGRADYPLAADFTAPIVDRTVHINEFQLALGGLFHPDVSDAGLAMLQPYDSQRIPVVLVHGLNSHPRMWRNVINELQADPVLRGRYQFWVFRYPSGWPISYSAMRLREELAALKGVIGPQRDMVFVGHSMGGLLSRMQVISPGRVIWDAQLGADANKLYTGLPADNLARRSFLYRSNKEIGRVIFVCVPHRGSSMADLSFAGWFSKLIRLPSSIMTAVTDLPAATVARRPLTSIAGLSPTNPLYAGLEKTPIEVPYHSIIGDRGKGNTPNSSDGVVPYSSSHLAGAQSEVIVPGPHGSYQKPQAIAEMKRILTLHLKSSGRKTSPPSTSNRTQKP